MDALKQQLLKVQQQLAGLSASQKMLTASLLVIMVMTLFYWSHFASTSEMEAVATPAAADVAAVQAALSAKGIKYEMQGDRVMVPTERKLDAQAALTFTAGGTNAPATDKVFDDALNASNPFESSAMRESRMQVAKQKWLGDVMQRWPNVTRADVILSGEKKLGVLHDTEATASVNLLTTTDDTKENKALASSARSFVARAHAGLDAKNVDVNVNGHTFAASDGPSGDPDDQLATRSQNSRFFEEKIATSLGYIRGVHVNVSVKVVLDSSIVEEHKVDPKNHIESPTHVHTENDENTPGVSAGEPGAVPNTGVSPDQPAAVPPSSTKENSDTENATDHGYTNSKTIRPAGLPEAARASVTVPESYLRKLYRSRNKGAEPTDADVKQTLANEMASIRATVASVTNLPDDKSIMIDKYADFDEPVPADAAGGVALAAMPIGVGFGIKESAIGALAVISLFMVMMMVKKGAPQPVLVASEAASPVDETAISHSGLLTVNEMAGEVAEGTNTLMGHELSEEALEAKQVIEQVGSMVKENPEVAANLVKRWLNQD